MRELFPGGGNGLELTEVSGASTLMASLDLVNPEVILLELSVAQPDPVDAVRLIHRAAPAVPLIILASNAEKDLAAKSLKQGATDYLIKEGMHAGTLERALRGALERNTFEGLVDLMRDPVTGLYIRDAFLMLGARAMEIARRKDSTLVLLCLRIENLSSIRVKFGSTAVEQSLRKVGVMLAGSFRRTDIMARLGESQFAALAIDAVEPSGPVLRQRLERRIAVVNRDIGPWGPLELRMSVGFCSSKEGMAFSEFLDSVESGLRASLGLAAPNSGMNESVLKP